MRGSVIGEFLICCLLLSLQILTLFFKGLVNTLLLGLGSMWHLISLLLTLFKLFHGLFSFTSFCFQFSRSELLLLRQQLKFHCSAHCLFKLLFSDEGSLLSQSCLFFGGTRHSFMLVSLLGQVGVFFGKFEESLLLFSEKGLDGGFVVELILTGLEDIFGEMLAQFGHLIFIEVFKGERLNVVQRSMIWLSHWHNCRLVLLSEILWLGRIEWMFVRIIHSWHGFWSSIMPHFRLFFLLKTSLKIQFSMMFACLVVGCTRHLVSFFIVANLHPVVHNVRGMVRLTAMLYLFLV